MIDYLQPFPQLNAKYLRVLVLLVLFVLLHSNLAVTLLKETVFGVLKTQVGCSVN